jgi:hypothetical protein
MEKLTWSENAYLFIHFSFPAQDRLWFKVDLKISRHAPLFIKETAMGLITFGAKRDNKSLASDFKLSFDPELDSGHNGTIREPLTGDE